VQSAFPTSICCVDVDAFGNEEKIWAKNWVTLINLRERLDKDITTVKVMERPTK
jgi:hypothetical protein